jgi:hypothetical protein
MLDMSAILIVQAVTLTANLHIRRWPPDHWLKCPLCHPMTIPCYLRTMTKVQRHFQNTRRLAHLVTEMMVSSWCRPKNLLLIHR